MRRTCSAPADEPTGAVVEALMARAAEVARVRAAEVAVAALPPVAGEEAAETLRGAITAANDSRKEAMPPGRRGSFGAEPGVARILPAARR